MEENNQQPEDSLSPEEKFLKRKAKVDRIQKGREEFQELQRYYEEQKQVALDFYRGICDGSARIKHSVAKTLQYIEENDLETASRLWSDIRDKQMKEISSSIPYFEKHSQEAIRAYEYFTNVGADMLQNPSAMLEQVKLQMKNLYFDMQHKVQEAFNLVEYYEKDENISRHWRN